ncbi:MAG: tetratricopeptide repeat protein [Acidobacteria bacterium]|nr:tetratricopeptide repeat protein [Acidobacteriota bacterium]
MLRPLVCFLITVPTLMAQEPSLEALREAGQWKQVRARIDGWYRAKPNDPYALLWMSRVKMAFNDLETGLDLARKAAALRPEDPDFQAQLGMAAGQTAGSTEGMMKQISLAREMKKALEASLATKLDNELGTQYLLQFYLQAPAIAGGGEGKAQELANRVLAINPVRGLLIQATIAFKAKNPEGAKAKILEALAKDPKSFDAQLSMANYHLRLKPQALDAAMACYRQAQALKPKEVLPYSQLAAILAEQGKWAELDATLAQARQAAPNNWLPYYSAGRNLIAENKHLDRAEGYLKTYLGQEPEGTSPDWAAAHWRLGQLYEKLGRKADAQRELAEALKLRPQFPQAKKDLERLAKG